MVVRWCVGVRGWIVVRFWLRLVVWTNVVVLRVDWDFRWVVFFDLGLAVVVSKCYAGGIDDS